MTVHPCCLSIKIELLGVAHVQGEEITQGGNQGPLGTTSEAACQEYQDCAGLIKKG